MLRSTIRKLARRRITTSRRPARISARRPSLAVEGLEDRMVPSTATLTGSTLSIVASSGDSILLKADLVDHSKLDVFAGPQLGINSPLGQFPIASIKAVSVNALGSNNTFVDDSNGFPFAPGTSISLFGNLPNGSLNLFGSRAIFGGEVFTAGTATQNGSLSLAGSTFQFTSAITSVTDKLSNTNPAFTLFVNARGQAVTLSGNNGLTEQLSGLASGGGGGSTLIFANKGEVLLEQDNDNATITLDATKAAPGLVGLTVNLIGNNDTLNINATPSTAATVVQALGRPETVNLRGNSGFVNILANKATTVVLGSNDTDFSKSVTSGINKDVFVSGAGIFEIANGGDVTTKEQVTVTESTVSGTGLFGNSGVVVHYSASPLAIFTGQLANTYTVAASHPGARFSNFIEIADLFSNAGLSVTVGLDSGSGLSLELRNKNPKTGLTSQLGYVGFGSVGHS